ncbi:MAG: DUF2341 domain-containing protein, partial [Pedobacter sp.]
MRTFSGSSLLVKLSLIFLFFTGSQGFSQTITNYTFAASTGTYSALSGATTASPLIGDIGNGSYNAIPIGFDFWYMGNRYTTISAGINGLLVFGADIPQGNDNYQLTNNLTTGIKPVLAPFWDNLVINATASVSYLLTGTAPNRVFTIQYLNVRGESGVNPFSMQIKLTETSGAIQYAYFRPTAATATTNVSASIGIGAGNTGSGTFLSLNNSSATPSASSTTETVTITPNPATNQIYTFTPGAIAAPTDIFFTDITGTTTTINWTDNAADDTGYAIFRSVGASTVYTFIGETAPNATSFTASGLTPGTSYNYRVYGIRESLNATPLTGSSTTLASGSGYAYSYPFNGNANEVIVGDRNGVGVNNPTLTFDRFGNANSAYYFNGSNYIYSGGAAISPVPTTFTYNLWFKTNSTTGGKLIGFGGNPTGSNATFDKHVYMNDAGKLFFGVYDGSIKIINTATTYNDNVWHNVVATLSSAGMKIYVDGILQASSAATTSAQTIQGYLRFGYDALTNWKGNTNSLEGTSTTGTPVGTITSDYFTGALDDIQIYTRELTTDEIKVGTSANFNGYAYKKTLTLNTKNIVSSGATLTNFPYLLNITDPDLKLNTGLCDINTAGYTTGKVLSSTGADIAFTTTAGVGLNFDIDNYDPLTGTLLVWVKLPSITSTTNLQINMLFGKAVADPNIVSATWPTDYKAVFHFDELSYTGTTLDATTSGLAATPSASMSSTNYVNTGKIGKAFTFNGSNQALTVPLNSAYALTAAPFTLSAWINTNNIGSDQKVISNQTAGGLGYKMGINSSKPENQNDGNPNRDGQGNVTGTSQTVVANTWYHLQGIYSGTTLSMYVNGELKQTRTAVAAPSQGTILSFGVGEGGNQYWFNGTLDEIRISNVAKSAEWIRTEYRNQNNATNAGTLPSIAAIGSLQAEGKAASTYPGLVFTFAGTNSNDPFGSANWTANALNLIELPATTTKVSVVIPTSKTVTLSNNLSTYGISVASGSTLDLNAKTLAVGCNVYNSGTITGSLGSLAFNGSMTTQDYNSSSTKTSIVNFTGNNTVGGTVNLNTGSLDVSGLLSLSNNTKLSVVSPFALTLKSTAATVSNVGILTGTSSITGDVSIETWFTGGAGKRGSRIVSYAIDETGLAAGNSVYQQFQKNVVVTGPGGTSNGFDAGNAQQPFAVTITKYNEPATLAVSQFTPIPSIKTGAVPAAIKGSAFFLFFRGSRVTYTGANSAILGTAYVPESFASVITGRLNQGTITVPITNTNNSGDTNNGYNIVGNPYPGTIDWDLVYASNSSVIDNEIRVIQPGGAIMTRKKVGNGAPVVTNSTNNANAQYIQPGQGMYIRKTAAGAGTLTFMEAHKAVTSTPNRTLSTQDLLTLKTLSVATAGNTVAADQGIQLHITIKDNTSADETAILMLSGLDPNLDNNDAPYFSSGGTVSLSSLTLDGKTTTINALPEIAKVNTIKLNVNATNTGEATLTFSDIAAIGRYKAKLRDAYLNNETDIKSTPTYTFTIDKTIPETFGQERFSIILEEPDPQVINLSTFIATITGATVDLNWTTYLEQNSNRFELERSTLNLRR